MAGFDEFIPANSPSEYNADLANMFASQANVDEAPSLAELEQQTSAYNDFSPSVKRFYQMTKSFDEKLEMVRKNQLEKLANVNDYQDIIPIAYKDSDTLRVLVNGKERDLRIGSGSTMYFDAVDDLSANGKNKSDISRLRQLEQVSQLTGKYFGDITDADIKNVKNYQSTEFLRRLTDPNYKEQKYDPTTIYTDPTGELQNIKLKAKIIGTDKHGRLIGDVLNPNTGRDLGFDMATNPYLNARFDLFGSMKGASSEAKLQVYEEGNKSIYNTIKEAREKSDYDTRLGEDIDLAKSTAYQMGARFAKLMPFTDDKYWNAIANSETGQKWADLATGVTDKTRTEFSQAGQNIQDSIAKGDYVGAVKETLLNFDRFFAESAPQMGLLAGSMIATGGLAAYGIGGAIAAKALGALPVALDKTLQDAEDFKVNNGRKMTSAEYARTFAGALLTTIPEELIFGMFGGTAKGILSNILKRGVGKASTGTVAKTGAQLLRDTGKNIAAGTAGEFFQEGLETGWDTASSAKQAGRNFWSDILPEAMTSDETLAAATIGGTMGGVFAGGMQGVNVAVNARTNKRLAEHLKAVDKDEMERNEEGTAASIDDSKSFMDNWKNKFTTVESVASLTPDQKHEQAEAIRDDMASANLNKKSSKYGTKLANHLDLLAWKDYHKQGLADEAIEEKLGRSKEDIFRATVFGSNLNSYELFKQNQKVSEDMQPQIEQELTELGKEMGISDEIVKKTMAEVEHDVRHGSSGYQTFTDKALRQLNKLKTESLTKEEKELLEADINGEVYSLLRLYGDQSHKIQAFTEAADELAQGTFKGSAPVKWSKDTDRHDFTLHASNLGNNTFESGVGAYGVVGSALSDLRNIEANLTNLLNNGLSKETFNELLERYNESIDTSHKALFGSTADTLEARFRNAGNNLRIKARDEAKARYASKQVKDIASDLQRLSNQTNLDKPKAMQIMQGIHSAITEKPELADQLKTYVGKWSNKDLKEKALKQLDNIVNLANTTASETAKAKETHDAIIDQVKSEISKLKEASIPHIYNEETDTTESINQKLGNLNSIKAQLDSWYKAFAGVASNTDEDNKIRADINSIREAVVKQYTELFSHSQFGKPATTSSSVASKLATFRKNLKNATNKRILSMQLGKAQKSYQKAVANNASKDEIDRLSGQIKALQDRIKELDSEPKPQVVSKPKEVTYTDEKGSFTVKFVPRKNLPKGSTLGVFTKNNIKVADDISLSDLQSPTYRVAKALKDKLKDYGVDYDAITTKFTQKELVEYIARHERHHYLQSKRYSSHEAFMKAYNASDIDMIGFELEALILPFVDMGKVSKETAQKAIETMAKQQAEAKARKQSQTQAQTTPENASESPETKGNGQNDESQGEAQQMPPTASQAPSQGSQAMSPEEFAKAYPEEIHTGILKALQQLYAEQRTAIGDANFATYIAMAVDQKYRNIITENFEYQIAPFLESQGYFKYNQALTDEVKHESMYDVNLDAIKKINNLDKAPWIAKQNNQQRSQTTPVSKAGEGYVNHSGGAYGSDTVWGEIGKQYGITSNHYYTGQRSENNAPNGNTTLTAADAKEGVIKATKAGYVMGRLTKGQVRDPKLIRNWNQVKYADAIFAISQGFWNPGDKIGTERSDNRVAKITQVAGGTGWAVQMAIDEKKPVYVFNQNSGIWYTYNYDNNSWEEFKGIPKLTKNFAGIGTRELNSAGVKAIASVYEATFGYAPKLRQNASRIDQNAQDGKTSTETQQVPENGSEGLEKAYSGERPEVTHEQWKERVKDDELGSQTLLATTAVKRVGSGEEAVVPVRPMARLGGTIVNTNKFIPFDLTKQIKVVDKADDFECLLASRYTLLNNFYGRDRISEIKAIANRIKFSLNMINSGNSAKLYLTKNKSTADGSYSSILDENPAHRLLYEIVNSDDNLFRGREGLSNELKNNAVFEYNELTLAIIDFSLREYIATSQLEDFFRSGALDKTRAASVFGLNDDSLDPDQVDALQQVVSKYGVPRSVMVNALGYLILRNMGIEENRDTSNYGFYERLAASLGAWAIDYGAELGLYELTTYKPKEDTDFHRPDGEPIEHPLKAKEVQLFKINKEHFTKINAIRDEYNGTKDPETGRRKANGLNQLKNTDAKTSTASVWDDREIDYKDKEKKVYVRHSNGMVELSDMKRSAMQRMANTKFRIDTDITDALDKDVLVNGKRMSGWDALARTMGYLEKEEIEQLGYNDRLTAEGQNLIIMKQIETLRDAAKKQNDLMNDPNSGWSKDNWDKGIRFQQFYSTNGRLFIDSSDLNPQTLKLHRCICLAEGMHFTYDPSLAESTDPKQREEWAEIVEQENFAIAQTFDSLGTREATDNFAEAMKSLTVDQLNDLRTILITNSDFNTGVFANESLAKTLTDAGVKEIGVENISQCLNTIQHLIRRQKANGKAFDTSLVVENDSTTSGYVIKMLQMPIESVKDFNGKNNILSKVGVIADPDLSPTGVLPIHEIKKLEGFQDLYKTTASLVSDKIDAISGKTKEANKARWKQFIKTIPNSKNRDLTENEKNHVTTLSNLFVAFHDALPRKSADGKISSDFRNLMKPATMVFGYSAGLRSIANKLAGTLMREYLTTYMSIVNAGNPSAYMSKKGIDPNSDKGKKITAIYNAMNRISGMYIPKKVNGKEDTFIEAVRDRAYASIYVTTGISSYDGNYKEGRKVSLEKLFQDLIGSTYGFFAGEALNTMFEPYVQINNEMVQMSTTMYQLYNRIYMNELGKLVKNDPIRSNLTSKEVAELKKKLHKFMPYITLPDNTNTGELGSDTSIMALTKFDKTRDGFNHSVNTYVGSDGKLVKGTSAYGNLYSPSNPGQSGAVIPIHGIDGSVMCNVIDHLQKDDDIVPVHDAIVMSAFKSNRISNYYNENLGLVCKDYNVYERMLIDLTRTLKLYTDYLTDEEFLDVPKEYRTKEQWEILNKNVIKTIMNDNVIDGIGKPVIEEFDKDGDHTYRTIDMLYEFVQQQNNNLLNTKNIFYAKNILISNLDAASGKGSVIMKGVTAEEAMFKEAAVQNNPALNEDITPVRTPEQATETLLNFEIRFIVESNKNSEEELNEIQNSVKNLANRINNNAKAFSSLEDFLTKATDTLTLSSDIAYYKTLAQDYLNKFDNIRKIKDITSNYDNNKLGLLKSRLSTLADTLEHNEQYDLVKKLNQKIKNIEKKQKTLGQDTNAYYYGSSPRGYQTNGAINNIYKAALDSTEGRVTALTDINNLARDSGNIVVSDEHMALLQSTVGCISPERVSDWILEVAENGEWNAGEADTARKHIQIVMDRKANGPLLDPVTKLSALSILAPAEIYAHELMHAANDYAFTHADVFGFNSQIKQLLAIQEEASKIIKPEDFMPKAGTYDPSLQQIYERQAQDFWNYIFNNSDIHNLRGLNEFCAFIASSEKLRKKLQGKSASIVVTAKPTKLIDRLIRIVKNIYDVIFGRKKFSEAFSNIYSALKGTSSLKRVNLLEDFDRLNRELHVVTTKAINPLFEHPMKVIEHMFGLASNLIRTGNNKLNKVFFKIFNYSDIKHDNLNKQAIVPDAPINATAWDRTKLFARVAKLQLTSGLQRRAMRLCLNELLGLQQQGIWLSVTRDLMGPDFDTSKLEALGLQTRMVDQNVKEQEAVTFNHLSEAFGRKLTDLENNSLTHAFLYPDTQVLWNGSNLDEVRTYLRSSDARKQDINNISSYFKNKLSKEDYSYFQYSVIGCAYNMIEGMGNPLLAMNAEAISKGLGWSNSLNLTPEEIAMVDKLITLHALENSNQDMLSVAAALPAKGLKEYLRAHQQFVKESKEGYEFQNEQGEIIKNRFIDSLHIIKGYTKQLVDPTLDCVVASPDELNPDEFKQKGYDEKASVMVNPVTQKSNVKVYTRFGIPLRRDGGIITVQGNHAMGQTLRRFAYAESDRIDELSTAHNLPAPGVNAIKLWMQYRRNADKQAIAIRNEIINRAKSGKGFTFTDFDLITAQHSTYSPIYDEGVAAPVDYRQTMSRDMKREHMGLDERGLTILSRMYGSINKQLNGNLANGVILEFLKDHQKKFMDEHHRDPKGNKFIKIEENSPNKFLRDAWRVIPQNFKDDIKANGDLWVREDWLQDLFGVPNYTLLSNEKVKQNTGYLVKRAIAIGEMIMKTIAYFRKQAIVLKIPGVLIGNIISNLMFSLMNHKNPITVVKATIANAQAIRDYVDTRKELNRILFKQRLGTATKTEITSVNRLKSKLSQNIVAPLMAKGMYQSIVEDLQSDELESIGRVNKWLKHNKIAQKTPLWLKNTFRTVFMMEGTPAYDFMFTATQYSDFIARCTEYQLSMKEVPEEYEYAKKNGTLPISEVTNKLETLKEFKERREKEISTLVLNAFINYDKPQSQAEQYLNDLGLIMFSKFAKRIQHVIFKQLYYRPINALLFLLNQYTLVDTEDILEQNLFHKNWMNLVQNPVDNFVQSVIPMPVLIGLGYQNPW